jgi:hypothetical protein
MATAKKFTSWTLCRRTTGFLQGRETELTKRFQKWLKLPPRKSYATVLRNTWSKLAITWSVWIRARARISSHMT